MTTQERQREAHESVGAPFERTTAGVVVVQRFNKWCRVRVGLILSAQLTVRNRCYAIYKEDRVCVRDVRYVCVESVNMAAGARVTAVTALQAYSLPVESSVSRFRLRRSTSREKSLTCAQSSEHRGRSSEISTHQRTNISYAV